MLSVSLFIINKLSKKISNNLIIFKMVKLSKLQNQINLNHKKATKGPLNHNFLRKKKHKIQFGFTIYLFIYKLLFDAFSNINNLLIYIFYIDNFRIADLLALDKKCCTPLHNKDYNMWLNIFLCGI